MLPSPSSFFLRLLLLILVPPLFSLHLLNLYYYLKLSFQGLSYEIEFPFMSHMVGQIISRKRSFDALIKISFLSLLENILAVLRENGATLPCNRPNSLGSGTSGSLNFFSYWSIMLDSRISCPVFLLVNYVDLPDFLSCFPIGQSFWSCGYSVLFSYWSIILVSRIFHPHKVDLSPSHHNLHNKKSHKS